MTNLKIYSKEKYAWVKFIKNIKFYWIAKNYTLTFNHETMNLIINLYQTQIKENEIVKIHYLKKLNSEILYLETKTNIYHVKLKKNVNVYDVIISYLRFCTLNPYKNLKQSYHMYRIKELLDPNFDVSKINEECATYFKL